MSWPISKFFIRHRIILTTLGVLCLPFLSWRRGKCVSKKKLRGGAILTISGVLLRVWAAGVLRKNESLCTRGPYALMRHPLYAGSGLIAAGHGLISGVRNAAWLFPLAWLALYRPAAQEEDARMAEDFSAEYSDYTKRTGAFFPMKKPGWEQVAHFSPRQAWRNREYEAVLINIILLLIYNALNRARSS